MSSRKDIAKQFDARQPMIVDTANWNEEKVLGNMANGNQTTHDLVPGENINDFIYETIDQLKDWDDRRYDIKCEIIEKFGGHDSDSTPDDIQKAIDLMTDIKIKFDGIVELLESRIQ